MSRSKVRSMALAVPLNTRLSVAKGLEGEDVSTRCGPVSISGSVFESKESANGSELNGSAPIVLGAVKASVKSRGACWLTGMFGLKALPISRVSESAS